MPPGDALPREIKQKWSLDTHHTTCVQTPDAFISREEPIMADRTYTPDPREDARQQEISRELVEAGNENRGSMAIMAGGTVVILIVAIALLFYVFV